MEKEILQKIKNLSTKEKKNLTVEELDTIMENLSTDEIIELSKDIGYPVFTRLCMGNLKHKFVLLQDGAAAIIVNKKGQILMQRRMDNDKWGLPGGCQELGESFEDTIIREIKEETNLDITKENLELVAVVSGNTRRNKYPNGDTVINNTVLYYIKEYSGEITWNEESKEIKFFDLTNLPENQNDPDLIEHYKKFIEKPKDNEMNS